MTPASSPTSVAGSAHSESRAPDPPSPQARPRRAAGAPPIEIIGLTKRFGGVAAVDDLTFTVRPGRVTGFLGPNGAGKTTTLRMLLGLTTPTSGTATFGGRLYADIDTPQQVVGASLEASFHPGRTGRDHLRVLAATADVDDERVDELLSVVELVPAARRPVGGYSLGMRQRLALAAALLGDPDYLILDEPANGLDPEGIRWLRGFLRQYASQGRAVLVSSHMLTEVQATVDDVVVIGRGRLLRQTTMSELEVGVGSCRVRTVDLGRATSVLSEQRLRSTVGSDEHGAYLIVDEADVTTVGEALFAAGLPVHELTRIRVDLEATFFAMLEAQA